MTSTSTSGYESIFKDGKLKPGIYKIQNIVSRTYLNLQEHTRQLCCRPATVPEGIELWEIRPLGPGYTIHRHEPGKPEQFCIILSRSGDGKGFWGPVSVAPFSVAWRLEMVRDEPYRGCEYVRFFWGTTNLIWDLAESGSEKDRTLVQYKKNEGFEPCRIWKLIPVKLDTEPQSSVPRGTGLLPPYDGNQRCSCSHQSTETNDEEFGTVVTEVTVTTTRRKYRVDGE